MKKLKNIDLNQEVDLSKVKEKSKGFWNEFKAFAIKGNAIDLAIGMVIGSAFTSIVNSLVKDLYLFSSQPAPNKVPLQIPHQQISCQTNLLIF